MAMNPRAYATLWRLRTATVNRGFEGALTLVGNEARRISLKHMNRLIYNKPIPLGRDGKPRWRRTNRLREQERIEFDQFNRTARLTNRMPYAEIRHEMGKPRRRTTTRPAHWRDETNREVREIALRANRDVIHEAFGRLRTGF